MVSGVGQRYRFISYRPSRSARRAHNPEVGGSNPPSATYLLQIRSTKLKSEKEEQEIGYIIGLYIGDGYIYHHQNSGHYQVDYYLNSSKDEDIIIQLKNILERQGYNSFVMKDRRSDCKRVRVNAKKLFLQLKGFDYSDLSNKSKHFKIGLLSGIIDSEGYVGNGTINVTNTDLKLLELCQETLSELEINSSLKQRTRSAKDKKRSYRLLISTQFKHCNHLSKKVLRSYPKNRKHYITKYPPPKNGKEAADNYLTTHSSNPHTYPL